MEYEQARAPSLVFWSNVLLIAVIWPLLVLKWAVVSATPTVEGGAFAGCGAAARDEAQREALELGLVVVLTCALMLLALAYWSLADPVAGESGSVTAALARHQRCMREREPDSSGQQYVGKLQVDRDHGIGSQEAQACAVRHVIVDEVL